MKVQVELTGTSALLMHNERLSDPDDKYTKAIKEITEKKKDQTEKDRQNVADLEWRGGLYFDEQTQQVIMPAANIVRCFRQAAAMTRDGTKIAGAFIPSAMSYPLMFEGPQDYESLRDSPVFRDRRQVKVQRGRISRTRPIFSKWAVKASFHLIDTVMNLSKLQAIGDTAGIAIGLCDARILGYGRFTCKISKS